MTVAFDQFLPEVLPFVPGLAEPIAENAIRQACIEFCERTDYWTSQLPPMASVDGVRSYELFPPDNQSRIHNVLSVFYNGVELSPKTPDELDVELDDWDTEEGTPRYYYLEREKAITLILVPVPDTTANNYIKVKVSLKPLLSGSRVADQLYYDHRKAISYGALSFLLRTPNKQWTNDAKAMEYERYFAAKIIDANRRARKAFTRRAETVQMRPWR